MKFEEAMLEVDMSSDESEDGEDEQSGDEVDKLGDQLDMLLDFTYKDIPEKN
jgi:hypothetical protein